MRSFRITHQIGTQEAAAPQVEWIAIHSNVDGHPRLIGVTAGERPATNQDFLGSVRIAAERQVPKDVRHEVMPHVEIGAASLGREIMGVLVIAILEEDPRCIVDRVGESVRNLVIDLALSTAQLRLQAVVDGVRNLVGNGRTAEALKRPQQVGIAGQTRRRLIEVIAAIQVCAL